MKKINLIEWLSRNSHEKQKPQRFARYAAMLIMLLTLGVGQMWGWTATFRCVPALTFGSNWSSGNTCKVKFNADYGWGEADSELSPTGLMYESGGNLYEIYSVTRSDLPGDGVRNLHFERWEGSTWKENKGQYDDWRNCSSWSSSMYYGSWGSYSYKTWDIPANTTIVWDAGEESWTTAQLYIFKDGYNTADDLTRVGSTTQFTKKYTTKWAGYAGLIIRKNNNWDAQTTNIYTDVQSSTTNITLFTYQGNKSDGKLNWQKTTDAKKATSGTKIYFDNTASNWNEIWLRYGTSWFVRRSASAASKVAGTDNLYVITIPNDAYYASYHLANNFGATNYSNITSDYNLSHKIALQSSNISSDITYIPTTGSGTGTAGNPKTWSYSTISGHTRTLTFGSHTNGNIIVTYTDENGDEQTVSSASTSSVEVAQTCKVVITAVPNTGYAPSTLTLGGASITSGAQQIIRADATIAATFVAETTYNITVSHKHGTRSLHDADVVSVGVTTPSSISSRSIDGFSFSSWSNLTNVTNKSADLTTDPISIVSTAVGSMTCNYTPWTCSMDVNTTSGNTGYSSRVEMSYDATVKAYFKEFTTTAATQYFRFYINSKKYAPSSNTEVVISGTKVATVTDVTGYSSDMPSVYFNDGGVGSKIKVWFDYENQEAWVEEVKYTVTISAGANGTVSPTSVSVGNVRASETITATADEHYHWSSWNVPSGVTVVSGSGTKSITIKATAADKVVEANFVGDNYTVTFNRNGSTEGDDMSNESFTYGTSKNLTTNTFARTGYTFQGWATSQGDADDGTVTYSDGAAGHLMDAAHNSTVELFAVWQANPYTVTLDYEETGKGTGGEKSSVSATYDAEMPAMGTAPVGAAGYKFKGYFTEQNGGGIKYYNADGTSAHTWDIDENTTLYAYFEKAEIATLPLSASMVHPWVSGGTMDSIDVTPTLTLVPEGTVRICYTIQYSDGSAVTDDGLQTFRVLGGDNIRFRAPQAAGSYRVHAELKTDDCSGTVLDTKNAEFAVAGDYSVTVKYICDGKAIRDQTVVSINALDSTSVTAPAIARYTFARWSATAGITSSSPENVNPKKFVATYDGVITAEYTETPIVYFKNNLGWSDVYVTYDATWNDTYGTGNKDKIYHHMTHIDGTDIWYDEVPSTYTDNGYANWAWNIAFNDRELLTGGAHAPTTGNYEWYNQGNVIYRRDFDPYNTFFVPAPDSIVSTFKKNDNTATYYSSVANHYNDGVGDNYLYPGGYWKRYNSTYSGWSLRGDFNSWSGTEHNFVAESADDSIFTTSILLYKDADKAFRLYKNMMKNGISDAYTNYGYNITYVNSHQAKRFTPPSNENADKYYHNTTVHSATEGVYVFKIHYTYKGTVELTIDFPMHVGDYEVLYKDDVKTAWHSTGTMDRNETNPITSLFVRKHKNPVAKWRKCTGLTDAGAITWGSLNDINLSSYQGAGGILENKVNDTTGVYNFLFTVVDNALSLTDIEEYTGDYYIRTDAAGGKKWADYIENGHKMTYSDYADANSGFSHYFMKYVGAGTNVKLVVANLYSPCISDTLGQDTQSDYVNGSDELIANANIRFSWNMHNNSLNRAYVGMVDRTHTPRQATRFIVLQGQADMLLDKNGNPLNSATQRTMYVGDNAIEFDDDENWVYETTVEAKADGRIKIYSHVNGHDYYLVGDSPLSGEGAWTKEKSDYLITGTGATAQKIRVIYDFKTGRLITAWLPSVAVNEPMTVKADVMIVREHQEAADQINMSGSGRITLNTGKTVYGVMRFNKYILNNLQDGTNTPLPVGDQLTVNERSNYYISFPFDVKISDIFGFGSYGPDFTLRYYDGKGRAKNGYWADSNSFWKYVPPFGTLNANEGYLLSLNMNNFTTSSDVWNNGVENIELYFPATGTIDIRQIDHIDIDSLKVAEYKSTINRNNGEGGDRRIADSFWRCIGVPSFAQKTVSYNDESEYAINWHTSGNELPFLYEVNWNTNDLEVQKATEFTFLPMHAYMVQNGNLIRWTNVISPASVARRAVESEELTFRLELNKNDVKEDQAYVRLTDRECVTSAFDFGQDLTKEFRSDANIYTFIGYERAAANSMPFSESTIVIPMGVKMSESGEYTFAMPDGTHGVSVILVDNMLNTRTNLGLLDYTAYLEAGQTEGRFSLEIAPVPQITTNLEAVNDKGLEKIGARKVLIDGILYIVKDGEIYDAQGRRL